MATEHQPRTDRTSIEGLADFLGDSLEILAIPAIVALGFVAVVGVPNSAPALVATTLGPFVAALLIAGVARLV